MNNFKRKIIYVDIHRFCFKFWQKMSDNLFYHEILSKEPQNILKSLMRDKLHTDANVICELNNFFNQM